MHGSENNHLENPTLAPIFAVLETLNSAVVVLDEAACVVYLSAAAVRLLGLQDGQVLGQGWATVWATLNPSVVSVESQPQRINIYPKGQLVTVKGWLRPVAGSRLTMVGLEDLSAEEARERETINILAELQTQADELLALYQITQFLNAAQGLDQLCQSCLRELERLTNAEYTCLYLAVHSPALEPKVWYGLADTPPPPLQNSELATGWFKQVVASEAVLALPLIAENRLIGLALLAEVETSVRQLRFLNTVAREMGTALQSMTARQSLTAKEQNLEAIVTNTTDAVIQVDSHRAVCDFNPAAEILLGYEAGVALKRSCAEVLGCSEEMGCGSRCIFEPVIASGEPIPYAELKLVGRNGLRHLAVSVAALKVNAPATQAAVAIMRDISRQKQIEQMKSDFAALVSHQLRTPLALLRGYTDTLQHLTLSPQEQEYCINGIAQTTGRLEDLVEQILDVSRIEAGQLVLDLKPVAPGQLVGSVKNNLPPALNPARLVIVLPPDLPLLYADGPRLEQVIGNLVENALKYSPPTSPVLVRAAPVGSGIQIQVLDEGIGIPPQEQELLFQKFGRASNARQSQLPGTGLGLFICRNIVEAHGGHISLSSEVGKGTCFTFWIPTFKEG